MNTLRSQGITSALVQQVVQEAASLGMQEVYLFTPNSEALYARLGWKVLEYAEYQGHRLTIMYKGSGGKELGNGQAVRGF